MKKVRQFGYYQELRHFNWF